MLIDDGILLRKYWFSVSDDEQLRRFRARMNDPVRQWKLSPMDLESVYRWEDYSRAKDEMMVHTDTALCPWFVAESDVKKHARLNMISHLLSTIDYEDVPRPKVTLPKHPIETGNYHRPPRSLSKYVPDHVAALLAGITEGGNHRARPPAVRIGNRGCRLRSCGHQRLPTAHRACRYGRFRRGTGTHTGDALDARDRPCAHHLVRGARTRMSASRWPTFHRGLCSTR